MLKNFTLFCIILIFLTALTRAQSVNQFGYPAGPDTTSAELELVGSTPYAFDVSGTGAATLSIPIAMPPGVGGMQPQIVLAYNSQSGNGVAGWGCNIAGISAITRTPKSIYYDGTAQALTHDRDDEYLLNGQRLIYAGPPGSDGVEGGLYYPESDPCTKVLVRGTDTLGLQRTWFEVRTKDGMKYHYGKGTGGQLYLATLPSAGYNTFKLNAHYIYS